MLGKYVNVSGHIVSFPGCDAGSLRFEQHHRPELSSLGVCSRASGNKVGQMANEQQLLVHHYT